VITGRSEATRLTGKPGTHKVRLPEGANAKQAQPVDLRGRHIGKPITVFEQPTPNDASVSRHWMFDVGCWALDVLVPS